MAKISRSPENEAMGTVETSSFALLANGSSGQWSVTLDESAGDTEGWFLQIEGPSLNLFCEVDTPKILQEIASALEPADNQPKVFVLGHVNRIPLRLQWDTEDENTLFFTVGPAARPLVRCSIHGQAIRDLANAVQQAALDLEQVVLRVPPRSCLNCAPCKLRGVRRKCAYAVFV